MATFSKLLILIYFFALSKRNKNSYLFLFYSFKVQKNYPVRERRKILQFKLVERINGARFWKSVRRKGVFGGKSLINHAVA